MDVANLVARFSAEGDERVVRALGQVDAGITRVADNSARAGRGLGTVFQVAGGFLAAQAVTGIFRMADGLINAQAQAEQAKISLEVVTGSAEEAGRVFENMQAFAAKTPFSTKELLNATILLESFGLQSEQWLTTIGDTASATGKSVDQVTQAVLDATTGEYERLKELGIKARVEGDKLTFSYMKNGEQITETVDKNNAEVIQSTLQGIWNDKYAGAMEKQSQTFAGQMSTLKDNVMLTMQSVTAGVFSFATRGLAFINDIFANGFRATIESTFGDTGVQVLDFFGNISDGASRFGLAIAAAFGEGAPVRDLVRMLPPSLQAIGAYVLAAADAVGDLHSAFQSGGLSGMLRQLPEELGQLGRTLLDGAKALGTAIVEGIRNTDLSGVGEAAGRFARTLIVGIAEWLPEHWDEVALGLLALFLSLPAQIVGLGTLLIPKAAELIQGFVKGLNINWSEVGAYFRDLPGRVVAQVPDLVTTLQTHGGGLIQGLLDGAAAVWLSVSTWLGSRGEAALNAVGDLSLTLLDAGAALLQGLWSGAEERWFSFTTWLENFGSEILAYVGDLSGLLWSVGTDIVSGMANGIRAGAGMVSDAVSYLVSLIPSAVRNLLNMNSPSRVMRDLAVGIPEGMALGITDGKRLVERAIGDVTSTAGLGAPSGSVPGLSPARVAMASGAGGGPVVYDLRGAFVGRGAEAEIRNIIAQQGATVIDRRLGAAQLAGARR